MTIKQQGGIFGRNPTFNDVTSETMLVDNLGIGTSPTNQAIQISTTSGKGISFGDRGVAGNWGVGVTGGGALTGNTGSVVFSAAGGGSVGLRYYANGSSHEWYVSGSEAFSVENDRNVKVTTGNLVIGTSGKGIDFSATSGTGTSELFDDYEEGLHTTTITPSLSGTISLTGTANTLFYTKIGNVVHVSGYLYVSAVSSPVGAINISLPFAAVNVPNTGGSSAASLWLTTTNSGANVADFVGVVDEGNSYLQIRLGDGASAVDDSAQQIKTGTQIKISLTYKAA